jgi:PKD repeat protein
LLIVTLAFAAFASSASAAAYCLHEAVYCDETYPANEGGLIQAAEDAVDHPGADRIEIASQIDVSQEINFDATPSNTLSIEGVGGAASILHLAIPEDLGIVINSSGTLSVNMSNLTIRIDGAQLAERIALVMDGGRLENVKFDVHAEGGEGATGARMEAGATCLDCEFNMYEDNTTGVWVNGQATLHRAKFSDAGDDFDDTTGIYQFGSVVDIRNSKFIGLQTAIDAPTGEYRLFDSIIDMGDNESATGVKSNFAGNGASNVDGTLDGVTIVGDGSEQTGVELAAFTNNPIKEIINFEFKNSLAKLTGDVSTDLVCVDDGGLGEATINTDHSFKHSNAPVGSGCAGSHLYDQNSDNVSADTLFVDYEEGDLRLGPDAPVIDAGDPDTVTTDRAVDAYSRLRFKADVSGTPTIDMGGSEYQNYEPGKPSATASTTTVNAGFPVDFSAFSLDGNQDSLVYTWDFGDGQTSTEQSPSHVYSAAGTYPVFVRASDGEFDSEVSDPITITVIAGIPIPPGLGGGGAGGGAATTPPPAAKLSFTKPNCKFKSNKKSKNGFVVKTTKVKPCSLQAASSAEHSYMFRLERSAVGFLVGGTCKAKQGKTGKAKRCDLPLKGTQTIKLPGTISFLGFGGRWNNKLLAPGKYKILVSDPSNLTANPISMSITVAKQGSTGRTK